MLGATGRAVDPAQRPDGFASSPSPTAPRARFALGGRFSAAHAGRIAVGLSLGAAAVFGATTGCSVEEPAAEAQGEPLGQAESAITVANAVSQSCSTIVVKGLSDQIIAQANCISPGAFSKVPVLPNVTMASTVFPYLEKPARDAFVSAANAHPGMSLSVNSMLRTVAQQYLLYHWYLNGTCGIGLAAVPGNSNHETGLAFDTSDQAAWKSAFTAQGFKWFGSADPVHFDYVGPGATNEKGTDIQAFQILWNKNNPNDTIAEDGAWGPATEARMAASPVDGFPIGADCGTTTSGPDVGLAVEIGGASDTFADGDSMGIADLYEGGHATVSVSLKNGGGSAATTVVIGVEVDGAFSLDDYLIESDWMNGGMFQTNEANSATANPAHGALGAAAVLDLHQLSPGETKRVTFPLTALAYSVTESKAPSVRVFVKEIPGVYAQDQYGGAVQNPKDPQSFNGGRLEIAEQADVYARTRWEWQSNRLEGFTASQGASVAVVDGSLELSGGSGIPYAKSPDTSFDAKTVPFLKLRAKRSGGSGDARIAFLTDASMSILDAPAFKIDFPADGAFHELSIDTSSDPRFTGVIHGLGLVPFDGSAGTFDVDYLKAAPSGDLGPGNGNPSDPTGSTKSDASCSCEVTGEASTRPSLSFLASLIGIAAARRRRRPRRPLA